MPTPGSSIWTWSPTREIAEFHLVEVREAFETAPARATGGVLDLLAGDTAMVEFTSLPADLGVDRILVVPVAKLRVIEPAHYH